jgi:hypothetical protein
MSALNILGAIASGLQIAELCITMGTRLSKLRSEGDLLKGLHADCILLLLKINESMLNLTQDGRQAAQQLDDRRRTN